MNEQRLKMLEKFLEEDKNDPFNWYALGTEYLAEQPEKAKNYFDHLLNHFSDYLPTYYHAAQLYVDFEDEARAIEIYKQGIELAKAQNNPKALRELSAAYQNLLFEME
ncbi:MAG: enzyme of heme biosynthesis [Cytophagales bacterium CG12_big_fil_rev_8_21_14_0_65_40_12]|nr:MAG: enzyme of heme biosynthesis [Cytophagales bacterium CG12_big_fil_rev_8_21_14_0_65_40_12]PIW05742.1 MAG: enzyme of heme biosynthesis [Cytophagales bacterium CG17_big_fil_post_rev_8_21_14_2_50_40_13]